MGSDLFSNREIALGLWALVVLAWVTSRLETRISLVDVLKALFVHRLLVALAVMTGYIGLIVYSLREVGLWELSQVKNTVYWAVSIAAISLFRLHNISNESSFFENIFKDTLGLTVVIEFVSSFHSLSLLSEIIIVPFASFLVILSARAEKDENQVRANVLITFLLILTGLLLFSYSAYHIISNPAEFATRETALDFALPPLLTALYLPFIFALHVYSTYERIFSKFKVCINDPVIREHAKWSALRKYGLRLEHLERWSNSLFRTDTSSESDIDKSISDLEATLERERNPATVPISKGWSPYSAKDFLQEECLKTRHYRPVGGDEWFAESNYLDVGDEMLPNTIAYFINGTESAATSLKLRLDVTDPNTRDVSHARLIQLAKELFRKALNEELPLKLENALRRAEPVEHRIADKVITVSKEEWPLSKSGAYEIAFIIEHRQRVSAAT